MDNNNNNNNPNDNWNGGDEFERRVEPHPFVRVYLKIIGLVGCFYLIYLSWCFYITDSMLNLRCYLFRMETDRCDLVARPSVFDIFALTLQIALYVFCPIFSIVAQLHHLIIWIKPDLWERMPKNTLCHWHRSCYFSLYHATFVAIAAAISNMLAVNNINPADCDYEQHNIYFYAMSSLRALWCFMLLFQFPIYSRMTVLDEHLLTRRRNMRGHENE